MQSVRFARRAGLLCRAGCDLAFPTSRDLRVRMQRDLAALLEAARERDAHELASHDLVFTPSPEQPGRDHAYHVAGGRSRWTRTRIGMNMP